MRGGMKFKRLRIRRPIKQKRVRKRRPIKKKRRFKQRRELGANRYKQDKGLGKSRRCSNCNALFEMTIKRRMLCLYCFATGGNPSVVLE